MLKARKRGLHPAAEVPLPAGLPVVDASAAVAFDIWKAGDGLPVRPVAAAAPRAAPAANDAPASADARPSAVAPAIPVPLPSLDGLPASVGPPLPLFSRLR